MALITFCFFFKRYLSLKDRSITKSSLSVAQVNEYLDKLASALDKPARKQVLTQLLHLTTALEQKWLVRIILKDLKLGGGEAFFFNFLHPDAQTLYNTTTNLRTVCETLTDPSKRSEDKMLSLFSNVKPMLAMQMDPENVVSQMRDAEFVIETKFDGNRIQVHRSGDHLAYFSRKGHNHYSDYSNSLNAVILEHVHCDNFIIDGELITWLDSENRYGKFKEVRSVGIAGREGIKSMGRLVYIVFDVLMLEGRSVMHLPLSKRMQILENMITPKEKVIEVVHRKVARSFEDIERAIDQAIENREEGIMIKDLSMPYLPNERKWIKIKPEYLNGVGDNFDLVIIGAFYGSGVGARGGRLSHFLLGVPAPSTEGKKYGDVWYSAAKVGTGYGFAELADLQYRISSHCRSWEKSQPPRFIELTATAEIPDVYLDPRECAMVLEIRCTSVEVSDKYRIGYTLRHPRVDKVRYDKGMDDCATYEDMMKAAERVQYAFRSYGAAVEQGMVTKKAKKKKIKAAGAGADGAGNAHESSRQLIMLPMNKPTVLGEVEKLSNLFSAKEFSVLIQASTGETSKAAIENLILQHGGTLVQLPGEHTYYVIAVDTQHPRVQNYVRIGRWNIVRPSWVRECVDANSWVPLEPRHTIFQTAATRQKMLEESDPYGDSFTRPLASESQLKEIFASMPPVAPLSHSSLLKYRRLLFPSPSSTSMSLSPLSSPASPTSNSSSSHHPIAHLFDGLVCFFSSPTSLAPHTSPLHTVRTLFIAHGGTVRPTLDDAVTHVVLHAAYFAETISEVGDALERREEREGPWKKKKVAVVTHKWVLECIAEKEVLYENNFRPGKKQRHL